MHHRQITVLLAAAVTAALTLVLPAGLAVAQPTKTVAAQDDPLPGKLLLMLDASGSMNGKDPSGLTKIAAAKKALAAVVDALPPTAEVGLRVYGATQPGGKPTPAACADTQLVHPITPLDKPGLKTAISSFAAKGETPIAGSLEKALGDLGTTGKRNIVLVSDGEESCVPDPCPVIQKLIGSGIDLQLDTVGFAVNSKAKKQLQCLADAGHGTYYDAKDSTALTGALSKLSQRALRSFQMQGMKISGGDTPETATPIDPGQYVDEAGISTKPSRYYRVTRSPGATLRLSLTAKTPRYGEGFHTDGWRLALRSPDDSKECSSSSGFRIAEGNAVTTVATNLFAPEPTTTTTTSHSTSTAPTAEPSSCEGPDFLAALTHYQGPKSATPFELRLVEEPPVTGSTTLPAAITADDVPSREARAGGSPTAILGGGSFNDALALQPGVHTDTVLPDEEIFYRVHLEPGQGAILTVDLPDPTAAAVMDGRGRLDWAGFQLRAWGPNRHPHSGAVKWGKDSRRVLGLEGKQHSVTLAIPEVRYNNRTAKGGSTDADVIRDTSVGGDYFYALRRDVRDGLPMLPVRLRLEVTGTPTGAPTYVTATTPPVGAQSVDGTEQSSGAGTGSGERSPDRSPLAWVGGGLVTLAAIAGGVYAFLRRRGQGRTHA